MSNDNFSIVGRIEFEKGKGDLETVVLTHETTVCTIYLHGATVASLVVDGSERLWMSENANYAPPAALRGGIPICFPQFGPPGDFQQHGFARNSPFAMLNTVASADETATTLELTSARAVTDDAARAKMPPNWRVLYTVRISASTPQLRLELRVQSPDAPLAFTAALHTYFRLPASLALEQVRVLGLQGLTYVDKTNAYARVEETHDAVAIAGEVDRVYEGAGRRGAVDIGGVARVLVDDGGEALPDVVVWNPAADVARRMKDFDDDGYKTMLCVESARVAAPATASPQQDYEAKVQITFE